MSRRRSTNPTKAISITLPQSLLDDIDDQLTRVQSRSAWIAAACKEKLTSNSFTVAEARDIQLCAALVERGVMSKEAYESYKVRISYLNPSEDS